MSISLRGFLLSVILLCLASIARAGYPVNASISAPSSVTINQSFTVGASGTDAFGTMQSLYVTKNGSYLGSVYSSPWDYGSLSGLSFSTGDTAPSSSGSITYAATATSDDYSDYASYSVTVTKLNQTISFTNPGTKTYGDAAFSLSASASSGLGVTFTVTSGPATVSGSTLTITGGGSVSVKASQGGNGSYNAASDVTQTFTVNPANQTISFTNPGTRTYGDSFGLGASASSGLGISYTVISGPASLSGSTLTITGTGSVSVKASQGGNSNYNAASDVTQTFTVNQASQTISFTNPGTKTYGDAAFGLSASATSGGAITFSVTSGPATVSGSTLTITGAGSVTVKASQGGNSNYSAASDVTQTFTVNQASQTISFTNPGTKTYGDAAFGLSASATSGGAITFSVTSGPATVSGSTLTITGAGSVTVKASQSGTANYSAASDVSQTFTVGPKFVTFNLPQSSFGYTGSDIAPAVGGSDPSATYSITGGTSHATYVGSYSFTVVGSGNYTSSSTTLNWSISATSPTITWSAPSAITYGTALSSTQLNASSGGVPGTFVYRLGSATGTVISAGTVLNAGDSQTLWVVFTPTDSVNYSQASQTTTLTVNKATATITLSNLFQLHYSGSHVPTAVTSPAGKTVTFTYDGSGTAPSSIGSYIIAATISDTNYQGTAPGTLVVVSPTGDYDGDGLTNEEEIALGTDPTSGGTATSGQITLKVNTPR
ncbi:MAG: hypothetical protein JSS11_16385 [Verrucomicrobia bacterium]|nr:hypothetical protein [Verrucomicrobiota bacterium]